MVSTKVAQEKKAKALKVLTAGGTMYDAARAAGFSTKTLYNWAKADPEFAAAIDEARDKSDDQVELTTFGNCTDPDASHNVLRMFWLKCRRPETFQDKQQTEHSGGVKILVQYADDVIRTPAAPPPGTT